MVIIFSLLLLFFSCFIVLQVIVRIKQKNAINAFKNADRILQKKYLITEKILENKALTSDIALIDSIKVLKEKTALIGTNPKDINRRIAFDTELDKKVKELIAAIELIKGSDDISIAIQEYNNTDEEFLKYKEKYNNAVHKLRLIESTFWQSLIARLNRIESFDYIK